jgi:hypothetical protein
MPRVVAPLAGIDSDLFALATEFGIPVDEDVYRRACGDAMSAPGSELVRVLSRSDFVLQGATGSLQTIPIANGIDTRDWHSAKLVVRMYSQTSWPSGSTIVVQVGNVLLFEDDPAANVAESRFLTTVTVGAVTPPAYFVQSVIPPIGAQFGVILQSSMAATAGQQIFTIGIDLVGRIG